MIYYNKIFHYKDSTTDTNETDANTVEMFSPPPPYPDELNYQFDLGGINNFEDEYRPFVPHLNANIQSFQTFVRRASFLVISCGYRLGKLEGSVDFDSLLYGSLPLGLRAGP